VPSEIERRGDRRGDLEDARLAAVTRRWMSCPAVRDAEALKDHAGQAFL
jgi:hypothetical protein